MEEVALFPIPNCVTFPGCTIPLHVFEPRYRQMIQYCLDNSTLLGICHTEEILSQAKPNQSLEEALGTNQATYKPYLIFSAGTLKLNETLEDGRMLIEVKLEDRFIAKKEKQRLPFLLYGCEIYKDHPVSEEVLLKSQETKEKIVHRLIALTGEKPDIVDLFSSSEWRNMNVIDFSFRLFGLLQHSGDIQQQILQCRSPLERLNIALQLLNKI